jgi:hypothetical protein
MEIVGRTSHHDVSLAAIIEMFNATEDFFADFARSVSDTAEQCMPLPISDQVAASHLDALKAIWRLWENGAAGEDFSTQRKWLLILQRSHDYLRDLQGEAVFVNFVPPLFMNESKTYLHAQAIEAALLLHQFGGRARETARPRRGRSRSRGVRARTRSARLSRRRRRH